MSVEWFGDRVLAAVRAATVTGLVRGVEAVRSEAVSLITTGPKTGRVYRRNGVSHQASAPGESPASDTGNLASAISTGVDAATLTGSVGFSASYAKHLEYGTRKMEPRPFARVAVIHKRDEIQADIVDEIGKVLR
jgi:HK97 gp10 family phage protein